MGDSNIFNEEVGLLRRGWIVGFDERRGRMSVKLNNAPLSSANSPVTVQAPHSLFYNNGLFIGTRPDIGTPVVVSQASGGEYLFVSFLAENVNNVPSLTVGELLITSGPAAKISLNVDGNIYLGSDTNKIQINSKLNFLSTNFNNEYRVTQSGRKVEGLVKRDLIRNKNYSQAAKLKNNNYEQEYYTISMDPKATPSSVVSGGDKNPPFVEHRETLYEFQYASNISDDLNESTVYSETGTKEKTYAYPNRRISRSDALSLSLVAPNYLMETIKGTVVDIFGNILDLNRVPLPVGNDQNTIQPDKTTDKVKAFFNIKELQRKSLAYHFELNARKDLTGQNGQVSLPDINSNFDYARNRSRFFLDIDKEGQFKLNVPASSETGNIPLLTRYENYSTYGPEDDGNPNKLIQLDNNQDIFHDSFTSPSLTATGEGFLSSSERGSISLIASDGGNAAPQDRITGAHMKHGMVYHDILQTCFVHQNNQYITYQSGTATSLTVDLGTIPELKNVANTKIPVSGPGAKAGGRSGSINLDGSLEWNIGANTIDRQSVWASLAGGMVANVGRDVNGRSVMASTGGDFFLQVGGFGITGDSRFVAQNNGIIGAVLDLRVLGNGGYAHMIRIDDTGITIMTPQDMRFHSKGNMVLTADGNIRMEAEAVEIQQRLVLKNFGGSI